MATIPIVNTFDKRVGVTTAAIVMVAIFIILLFIDFEVMDPPPPPETVIGETEFPEELILENLIVESGGTDGAASDAPIDDPKPQTQEVITSNNPNDSQEVSGQSHNTNSANSSNTTSTTQQSNDPFANGGSSNQGTGQSEGNDGPDVTGQGSEGGNTASSNRHLIRLPDWSSISRDISVTVKICLKLTISPDGKVVYASVINSKTTTSNNVLIQKVKNLVLSQAKYNAVSGSGTIEKQQIFTVKPL